MTSRDGRQLAFFADEVGIDFPAVGDLAERVREGFLSEPPAVHALEVRVSSRQARLGAIVPLQIPLRITCPECGGRGETWTDPCAPCLGTGSAPVPHPVRFSVPPGSVDGARFLFHMAVPEASPVRVEVRLAVAPSGQ